MRYRVIAAVLFVVAVVGAKATLGFAPSPTDAEVAPEATALPTSTPNSTTPWDISGTIQQMNGEFWEIQGFSVRVTASTEVTGDLPSNGVFVRAQGKVDSDGTWLATRVWVGAATTPTAATASEATAPSLTPTASATPTSSATATPSPTATVTPKPSATPAAPKATPSPTKAAPHPSTAPAKPPPPTATAVPPSPSRPGGHSRPGRGKKG